MAQTKKNLTSTRAQVGTDDNNYYLCSFQVTKCKLEEIRQKREYHLLSSQHIDKNFHQNSLSKNGRTTFFDPTRRRFMPAFVGGFM